MTRWWAVSLFALTLALPLAADEPTAPGPAKPADGLGAGGGHAAKGYPHLAAGLVETGVTLIDVRTGEEVEQTGIIEGAIHLPRTDIDAIADRIISDRTGTERDRAVVLYCRDGQRAGRLIDALRDRGISGMVNAGSYDELAEAIGANSAN